MTAAPLRLMLVDEDPVFRLGLKIWLEQTAGYQVVAEASDAEATLAILASLTPADSLGGSTWAPPPDPAWADAWMAPADRPIPELDLIILDLGLGAGPPDQLPGLRLCADLKARYPALPILVISAQTEPVLATTARQLGADGFGSRSMAVGDLHRLIQQLARPRGTPLEPASGAAPAPAPGPGDRRPPPVFRERPSSVPGPSPRGLTRLRLGMRLSAVQQIEAVMAQIEAEQRRGRGTLISEALLAGRYRELKAARWLVRRLLATPDGVGRGPVSPPPVDRSWPREADLAPDRLMARRGGGRTPPAQGKVLQTGGAAEAPSEALAVATADRLTYGQTDLGTRVFDRVFNQCQGLIDNTSGIPLETDILRDDKKRELLYLTLRKFEDALDSLRQAEVPPGQLAEKSPLVLRDIWEAVVTDFFGRYYTLQINNVEQPVVPTLLAEAPLVQAAMLDRIPLVPMLLGHLIYNESMVVDGGIYEATAPEAIDRSQALLEHLLIQLANAVVQPVLNNFADVELLKKNLYQRRMMTSRDIERFRNDLSWRYRWDGLVNEPKAIFESQYRLLGFTERGIQSQLIYAPRRDELDQLSGLQRVVTLTVEARDAIAPRFRSAVSLVGSGIVYVLTDVIGRGIGLIGRGILRGVGGAWRDPRYRHRDGNGDSDRQEF